MIISIFRCAGSTLCFSEYRWAWKEESLVILIFKYEISLKFSRGETCFTHSLLQQKRERDRESKRNLCCHQCWAYAGIIRGGNLALMQTSNCQKNNLSQTKERPLWCWGLWFLSYLFLWGFTWQNAESCFVPLPVMLHPLTGVPPPPLSSSLSLCLSCCLAVCAVSP